MHGHTSGLQSGTQTHLTEIGQTLLSVSYTDLSKTPGEVLMGGGGVFRDNFPLKVSDFLMMKVNIIFCRSMLQTIVC